MMKFLGWGVPQPVGGGYNQKHPVPNLALSASAERPEHREAI